MDNTERFSNRVADYVRHRPDYPEAVVRHLEEVGFLFDGATVADVGSGTGIFTRLLLRNGYEVFAVEPNDEMRSAAELESDGDVRFHSVAAGAEATTLGDAAVDLVTAAQALHWFDPEPTREEFMRITRPPHRLAAVWNRRDTSSSGFLRDYEALLQARGIGYTELMEGRDDLEARMQRYFGNGDYDLFSTPNAQTHDLEGLVGRLLSSSYGPKPGHPAHEAVMEKLREIFDRFESGGEIEMIYETRVYYGAMTD